ncbi:hypothetical protein H7Y29_00405 [Microbacteriaceae bacterium]|nr:hypothetical protein [Candidatus Saccharibacteria bacterium]
MSDIDSLHSIELAIFSDGRLELDVPLAQYDEFNASAKETEGSSLSALAESDPASAYTLIRKMLGSLAVNTNKIYINDVLIVSKSDDGEEATRNMAANVLVSRMPDASEGPFSFSLGVPMSDDDRLLFGEGAESRMSVLDIVVEPPSYI